MITVRYFGSLKESIGRSCDTLKIDDEQTVFSVWQTINPKIALQEHILTAVNMDYVERNHCVIDGDEVAFFPPVTGG